MTLTPKENDARLQSHDRQGHECGALAACRVCGSAPAVQQRLSIAPGVHVYADGGHHIID